MPHVTPLQRAYAALARLALPFALRVERRKLAEAGTLERFAEKRGVAGQVRPKGRLIWFHAASVGESLSVLSLIGQLAERLPDAAFLITSGTPTSADLVAQRMPPRCRHQFAPLDAPGPVARFLDHWRPDAAVFVESELWPNMLRQTATRGVPMALLNARMSARSAARWRKTPATARALLGGFRLIVTQNAAMAQTMRDLGAAPERVVEGVNLKSMSAPLPVDAGLVADMRTALGGRPVWVASSTHEGEEEIVLAAHEGLLTRWPDLCLILAPRHPARREAVAAHIAAQGWPVPRRSAGVWPEPGAPVYLADSLGELGAWYALTDVVFLGGSLREIGGHNPFEVAQAGAAIVSGRHVANFAETFEALTEAGAARFADSSVDCVAAQVAAFLGDADALERAQAAARDICAGHAEALEDIVARLVTALGLDRADG